MKGRESALQLKRGFVPKESLFIRFLLTYSIIWIAVLIGFISVSMPIMREYTEDQINKRLLSNAAILDEYLGASGAFTKNNRPELDLICKRLDSARMRGTWITLFSPNSEILADSRRPNPKPKTIRSRPEVSQAMRNSIGTSIRYSDIAHRRMAFLAYPHVWLGEVQGVVRIGIPYSSLKEPLWYAYLKIAVAGFGLAVIAATCSCMIWLYKGVES
ncbi:MAG TPA: hypothetical protein VJ385_14170 [Fibrobacteria bacterium]|nr:hypothetical protein [Fibrobacteria bacterium]